MLNEFPCNKYLSTTFLNFKYQNALLLFKTTDEGLTQIKEILLVLIKKKKIKKTIITLSCN